MDEQRLIDLETKISHQELAVEALQRSLYEQQQEVAKLQDKLSRQMKRLDQIEGGGLDIGPANEKPPHY